MPSSASTLRHPRRPTLFPYTTLFRSSAVGHLVRYGAGEIPESEGTVKYGAFSLAGQNFVVMDSARTHPFAFNEAISFMVRCENQQEVDRKSTRLNSSHMSISYAVFCLNTPAPTQTYTLSLHDALPIFSRRSSGPLRRRRDSRVRRDCEIRGLLARRAKFRCDGQCPNASIRLQ